MNNEISIVIVENEEGERIVCAFPGRKRAMDWFQTFYNQGKNVSIHSVEIDDSKEFIQLEE